MIEFKLLILSLAGSVLSVCATGIFLFFPEKTRNSLVPCLVSYATGTLLGAAFLGLLPNALVSAPVPAVLAAVLGGIFFFLGLEKTLLWRHCHKEHCELHSSAGTLIVIGDALHNFMDGVLIGSAMLVSPGLAVSSTLAVVAHEIPQETGDFAIMLSSGWSRKKAFAANIGSSLTTLPGAFGAYYALSYFRQALPYVMAVSAASFIYIALADLIPAAHRHPGQGRPAVQFLLGLAGVATIALFAMHHH
ncbi:MAG: ZIP zinc transporter [Elusimicrobia bacterium CG08_land_8_20_14_0_20_59_10]|nr:MAG: ZIP zinc transporter [Elusimicrobia bacterium CG08_land_8_20_14_0_20_59_10]